LKVHPFAPVENAPELETAIRNEHDNPKVRVPLLAALE
jgi:signal transduction histidine kinase